MNQTALATTAATDRHASPRVEAVGLVDPSAPALVARLTGLATRGLRAAYDPADGEFAQTVRGVSGPGGVRLQREGTSLRYAAMAALGLSRLPEDEQRAVLAGRTAAEVAELTARLALRSIDPGAVALAVWAYADTSRDFDTVLFAHLTGLVGSGHPIPTVDAAWALTAAVKANGLGDTDALVPLATDLLERNAGPAAIYPHVLPPSSQRRWRAHVGSFADQVYPLQALALASRLTGDRDQLALADRTAERLCDLQGRAGQWWWHYDSRDGSVVERFPVYSVHQHAMAPMVMLDLWEAGGADHRAEVARGLGWLDRHPEVVEELVSDRFGVVWRKVGRREPPKAARAVGALTTSLRAGLHAPGLDLLMPATSVDHECRPYELGWLLYAWLPEARDA